MEILLGYIIMLVAVGIIGICTLLFIGMLVLMFISIKGIINKIFRF